MFKPKDVKVFIPALALKAICDECDGFDVDETGGRLIGRYQKKHDKYEIEVTGIIGAGPNARRSSTSFFQDGEFQAEVFRSLEEKCPNVEHLGNWHTHHVNGFPTLSGGDQATYQRTVNHEKHNTDFFYAILVTEKTTNQLRYKIRHFFFRRNDPNTYEIPSENVRITSTPIIWPTSEASHSEEKNGKSSQPISNPERVKDQEFFKEHFPQFKPLFSKSLGSLYWKGQLELVDGSAADLMIIENEKAGRIVYSAALSAKDMSVDYSDKAFKSAREAVLKVERDINKHVFAKERR